jgi:hypothetical protein
MERAAIFSETLIIWTKRASVAESFVDLIDLNRLIALFLQFPVNACYCAYHDKACGTRQIFSAGKF